MNFRIRKTGPKEMSEPRPVIQLDSDATRAIIDHHRGSSAEPLFIIFTREGNLWKTEHLQPRWVDVVRVALNTREQVIAYNSRSKKASLITWKADNRTIENHRIQSVRLVPHAETIAKNPLKNPNARLFHVDEFTRG